MRALIRSGRLDTSAPIPPVNAGAGVMLLRDGEPGVIRRARVGQVLGVR